MDNVKIFRLMERVWLVFAILLAALSIYIIASGKTDEAKMPLFGTFAAALFYGLRRYQRKKAEKNIQQ
jgi:hypothetical protein